MFQTVLKMLGLRTSERETDVTDDSHLAQTRAAGGAPGGGGDAGSTTGTGSSGEFVGRTAGQDDGAERLSGAEARALGADEVRADTGPGRTPGTDGSQPAPPDRA